MRDCIINLRLQCVSNGDPLVSCFPMSEQNSRILSKECRMQILFFHRNLLCYGQTSINNNINGITYQIKCHIKKTDVAPKFYDYSFGTI